MDRYTGDITATRHADGRVTLVVTPGPLRASRMVLDQADPEFLSWVEDIVTFHSMEPDGTRTAYRYRVTGDEYGPEGGWLLLDPIPD